MISVQLLAGNKITSVISKTALTNGQWEVNRDGIWYDSAARLVYFIGNKESVLEDHLYAVSLDHPNVLRLLTDKGFTHVIYFNKVNITMMEWGELLGYCFDDLVLSRNWLALFRLIFF